MTEKRTKEDVVVVNGQSVKEQLLDFIVMNFLFGDVERKPDEKDSLINTGVLDSTGILELIQFLEATFGITVEDNETVPQNLDSVDALVRYIARKRDGAASQ